MNLIDLSIRRPVFAWVLMFGLIVFGAVSMNRLGVSQMPDINFPILNISIAYEGAAPEVVEADLLDPIEEKLLSVEGIKEMRSTANQGSASITLEFDIDRNVDVALQEVQSAISQLRLPPGVDPPILAKKNPDEDPIIYMSVYGGDNFKDMLVWVNAYLIDQLSFVQGVGEVSVAGFSDRSLRIWIDPIKLRQHYIGITDVIEALRTQHVESAAGQFVMGQRELRVRWLGEGISPNEVGEMQILKRGGQLIRDKVIHIKDVASVEDGLSDIRRLARVGGTPAVNVAIKKQRGTNEVQVAKAALKKLEEIKDRFPKGYKYRVNIDFTRSTESTVALTVEKLWVAALITILVCYLFLGSIPAAINILFSIPTSIVGTFTVILLSGFTLNLFTLLALTLAISIVVDDAIMLLENIMRHYRMGKGSQKAASDGAKEVLPAAAAATLAVIAVFLPVIFMKGIIGKFFFQFGVTMSGAVLLSLLEAVTITPMRSAAFLVNEPKISKFEAYLDHRFERFAHLYQNSLRRMLNWRYAVVFGSIGLFAASLFLVREVRQEFVPAQDQDIILVAGLTPPGTSLDATNEVAKKLEEVIKTEPNVTGYFVSIGAGPGGNTVNAITMPLTLKSQDERNETHVQIMGRMRGKFKAIKGVIVSMRDISARNLSTGRPNPLALNIRGPDLKVLAEKSDELMKQLSEEGLAVDLDKDFHPGITELLVKPKRLPMTERGVSVNDVGTALSAAVGGLRQGRYTAEGRRYDIRFKFRDSEITKPEDLGKIEVWNLAGNLVPLSSMVEVEERPASQTISRINRQRSISVFGNIATGKSQQRVLDRAAEIIKKILPVGYDFGFEGASAGFSEAFGSLFSAMMIGILVAYLILAAQFNSFIHPVSVLIALPFSVTGAVVILWATGNSLNLFSFIGIIVLMGIAKKNSILLVEFTNQVREHNPDKPVLEALLEACPVRLRPVLMTSVATVAAATPLVFGHALGHEARAPMGLAIIGGTIVSTALTLYVVPCLYLVLTKFESKRKHHFT